MKEERHMSRLLQEAIDTGMASGISGRSFEEIMAEADREDPAGHA